MNVVWDTGILEYVLEMEEKNNKGYNDEIWKY